MYTACVREPKTKNPPYFGLRGSNWNSEGTLSLGVVNAYRPWGVVWELHSVPPFDRKLAYFCRIRRKQVVCTNY